MTIPAETARSSAAERMRLRRERRRNGMRSLWIELRVTKIDALIRIGLLKGERVTIQTESAKLCMDT